MLLAHLRPGRLSVWMWAAATGALALEIATVACLPARFTPWRRGP